MAETKTEVKTLGYMVDGEWRESQTTPGSTSPIPAPAK